MTPPQITVADGYTLNPGDLDWSPLRELGQLVVHDRCGDRLVERCQQATIILTNKERFDAKVLAQLPLLRFISILATGTNVVDLSVARTRGIVVSNVPAYSTASVVQHVFALLLQLTNHVAEHAAASRDGRWTRSGEFSYRLQTIGELAGKTMGVVGMGAIGTGVADVAMALGMRVLAAHQSSAPRVAEAFPDVRWAALDQVFAHSDVLTLHCPLTDATRQLVNERRLALMRPGAILINTGRGDLVDEEALATALHAGRLGAAGLDVLSSEPPPADHPLLHAPRCVVTPHLAWASLEARQRLLSASVENVRCFLLGAPQNVVN